jgi:hypothetical protein
MPFAEKATQPSLSELRARAEQVTRALSALTDARAIAALTEYLAELEAAIGRASDTAPPENR